MNLTSLKSFLLSSNSSFNDEIMTIDKLIDNQLINQHNLFEKISNNSLFNTSYLLWSNDTIKLYELIIPKSGHEFNIEYQLAKLFKNIFVIIFFSLIFIISLFGKNH